MFDRQSAEFFIGAGDRLWASVMLEDDVISGTTGIPLANFNGATNARFAEATADERIEAILRPFRDGGIGMTWWVGPTSTPADLAVRLVGHGLHLDMTAPGMACPLGDWSPPPGADEIETELVIDAEGFHVATEIMFAGFDMPAAVMPGFEERYIDFVVGPLASQRVFLARLDGRPVATSMGFLVDGVVGIYNVATVADARRRGAGAAVTSAALADGQGWGAHTAILESSPSGRSVYERLGFRQVCEVTILAGAFDEPATE